MKVFLFLVFCAFALDEAYAPFPGNARPFVGERQRANLVRAYFKQGYAYRDIVLFLATMHGIKIGVDRLKQILFKLGLRRRQKLNEETVGRVLEAVRSELEESGEFAQCL